MEPAHRPAPAASPSLRFRRPIVWLLAHLIAGTVWAAVSSVTADFATTWIVVYAGVALAATGLLNRWHTGWLGAQFAIGAVWGGATFKERLLQEPLLAHDVVFFIRNLAANAELVRAYPGYTFTGLAALALAAGALLWSHRKEAAAISLPGARGGLVHALLAVGSVAVVAWGWSAHFQRRARQQPNALQTAIDFMRRRGVNAVPSFVESFWDFALHEPHDLPQAVRFQALRARSPERASPPAGAPRPDIMVVLRESHVPLARLWGGDLPPSPAAQTAARTDWRGEMRVHSFGGGTWLTEFAFLTGFGWADFGNAGLYAPFTLAPRVREALPAHLRRLGYRTVAFYPVHGTFLNARVAYSAYGFERFFSSEELELGNDWSAVSDRSIYAAALRRLHDEDDGRPVFVFILTIMNHGPHNRAVPNGAGSLPHEWPSGLRSAVADYLDRQQVTERDFAWLQDQWLGTSRHRLLVGFGDHWPSLEGGLVWLFNRTPSPASAQRQVFRTPLQFTANYAITAVPSSRDLDVAYVGGTLLEFAGLEAGEFFRANQWLRDRNAGAYTEAPDQNLVHGYLTWAHEALGAWR